MKGSFDNQQADARDLTAQSKTDHKDTPQYEDIEAANLSLGLGKGTVCGRERCNRGIAIGPSGESLCLTS